MDGFVGSLGALPAEYPMAMLSVLVFAATATLAFGVIGAVRVRGDLRRRTAQIAIEPALRAAGGGPRSLRHGSIQAAQRLVDYANRHFSPAGEEMRVLRSRLVQAGYLDPRAGAF